MRKLIYFIVIIVSISTYGQDRYIQLNELFSKLQTNNDFNGNVLVAENGKPIFKKSYGVENEEKNIKLSSRSIFNLASITKQFTATSIVILKNKGKISYDDKLEKYFPKLSFYEGITIRNLINHTSGLPDYSKSMDEHWNKSKIADNKDVIKTLEQYKPKKHFEPNEKWEYSNTGYLLLASIIEKVSNQSFNVFLQENIFKPLEMNNTFIHCRRLNPKKIKHLTVGYSFDDQDNYITPDDFGDDFFITYLDGIYGDGNVFSTTEDLLKWDKALRSGTIVSNSDKSMMFFNSELKSCEKTNYGFGWFIENDEEYGKILYHGGRWGGYITYIERHLDSNKTVIILQNLETEKTTIPTIEIRNIMYNKVKNISIEVLKKYAGLYKTKSGSKKKVILKKDKLYVPNPMSENINLELIPVSTNKFVVSKFSPAVSYEFLLNNKDKVTGYRVKQKGESLNQIVDKIE